MRCGLIIIMIIIIKSFVSKNQTCVLIFDDVDIADARFVDAAQSSDAWAKFSTVDEPRAAAGVQRFLEFISQLDLTVDHVITRQHHRGTCQLSEDLGRRRSRWQCGRTDGPRLEIREASTEQSRGRRPCSPCRWKNRG